MKKITALALSLIMILCAVCALAEDTGKTEIGTLKVGESFSIQSTMPEGYTYMPITVTELNMVGILSAGEGKPAVYVSIAYNEEYAETERFNDVDEATVEEIRDSFREEDEEVTFEDLETAYGTRLLKVAGDGFVDLYTIYKSYELEFVLTGAALTDADVQMLVDFISDMDFVTVPVAEEAGEKTYGEEHPGVLAFDSYWVSGDAQIRIDAHHTDGGYELLVVEMTGENTFNSWEYLLTYDEETKSLVADKTGMKSACTFDETGTVTASVPEYEDGSARFFINDLGQLAWDDEKEDTFSATAFNRIGRFPGRYAYDRAYMEVNWAGEGLLYDVSLDWADSAFETWHWMLSGSYDPVSDTLVLSGVRFFYTYKEGGELDLDADRQEEEVSAVFAFDSEGFLVVPESTDPSIMGWQYEPDPVVYGMWMWQF